MSLLTATLGWGVVSRNKALYFNIPYVGTIYIGMSIAELNRQISANSQMGLQVRVAPDNRRRALYLNDNNEEVFSIVEIGNSVCRLRYNNIVNMIPSNLIYQVKKSRYVTDVRIDGHMLAIKDNNEIWLKEVDDTDVHASDITSQQLGVKKQALTKKKAQENSEAWMSVFNTKSVYAHDMYSKDESEVRAIEGRLRELKNQESQLESKKRKIKDEIDRRKELDSLLRKQNEAEQSYNNARKSYTNAVNSNKSTITHLVDMGKLRNDNGYIRLVANSNNTRTIQKVRREPVYETVTSSYEPEMLLHEDYEQYERRRNRGRSTTTSRRFVGYRDEPYTQRIVDKEFMQAKEIAGQLSDLIDKCEETSKRFIDAQNTYKECEQRIQRMMQTSDFKNQLSVIDDINRQLKVLKVEIDKLSKQLYGH